MRTFAPASRVKFPRMVFEPVRPNWLLAVMPPLPSTTTSPAAFNMLNAAGDVVVEGNGGITASNQFGLTGSNTILGNFTLEAGANVRIGEYYQTTSNAYGSSSITFGSN